MGQCHHKGPYTREARFKAGGRDGTGEAEIGVTYFEDGVKSPLGKEYTWILEAGRDKETDFLPEVSRSNSIFILDF